MADNIENNICTRFRLDKVNSDCSLRYRLFNGWNHEGFTLDTYRPYLGHDKKNQNFPLDIYDNLHTSAHVLKENQCHFLHISVNK